jgi:hypothetical protein
MLVRKSEQVNMKGVVKLSFDYSRLRGKIREVFGTQAEFTNGLGINNTTLSAKLNNYTQWNQQEIVRACELLNIDLSEIPAYFFTLNVRKDEQK